MYLKRRNHQSSNIDDLHSLIDKIEIDVLTYSIAYFLLLIFLSIWPRRKDLLENKLYLLIILCYPGFLKSCKLQADSTLIKILLRRKMKRRTRFIPNFFPICRKLNVDQTFSLLFSIFFNLTSKNLSPIREKAIFLGAT